MIQTQICPTCRQPAHLPPISRRRPLTKLLRDAAFVLEMTRRVKEAILGLDAADDLTASQTSTQT